jgi:hypothetical protein
MEQPGRFVRTVGSSCHSSAHASGASPWNRVIAMRYACDLITKRFGPFRNPELPEVMPRRSSARPRVPPQLHQLLARVKPGLPGLAGHDEDSLRAGVGRVKRNDVDIGWDTIEVGDEVGMRSVRFEADIVRGEVPLELQVVVDDLLEDVFFHRLNQIIQGSSSSLITSSTVVVSPLRATHRRVRKIRRPRIRGCLRRADRGGVASKRRRMLRRRRRRLDPSGRVPARDGRCRFRHTKCYLQAFPEAV